RDAGEAARAQPLRRLYGPQQPHFGAVAADSERRARIVRGADGAGEFGLIGWGDGGAHAACRGKTLGRVSSHAGSEADLMRRCCASSVGVNCTLIRSRFSTPTPCSPVRQPPTSTQRVKMSAPNFSAAAMLAGSLASNMIRGCRLPSPAWKMLATCKP